MAVPVLDPQIAEVLRQQAEAGLPPTEELSPEEQRANYEKVCKEQFGPVDEVHSVEDMDADGVPVRSYRDLTWKLRLVKVSLPIRESVVFRAAASIPWRVWRRLTQPTAGPLRFTRLRPNYEHFWMSDADACASIDSHEAILFFERRGYEILNPAGGVVSRLLFRAGPIIVRKMSSTQSQSIRSTN